MLISATHGRHRPRHTSPPSHNRSIIPKLRSYNNRNNRNKFSYEQPLSSYDHVPTSSYETPASPLLRTPSQPAPRSWQHPNYPTPPSDNRNTYPKLDSYNNRNNKCYQQPLILSPTLDLLADTPLSRHSTTPQSEQKPQADQKGQSQQMPVGCASCSAQEEWMAGWAAAGATLMGSGAFDAVGVAPC